MNLPLLNGWGEKHRLFVKWKYVEAKVRCNFLWVFAYALAAICISSSEFLFHYKHSISQILILREKNYLHVVFPYGGKKLTSSDSSRIFFFLINVFLPKKIPSWSLVFSTLVITC